MDDPSVRNVLYDPADEPDLPVIVRDENEPLIPVYTANPFYFASYLQPDEKLQPIIPEKVPPPKGALEGQVNAPRLPVRIEIVPGGMVFIGNPDDVRAVIQIIEALQRNAAGAKVEVQLVPVRLGDPTDIAARLSLFLSKVQLDPNFTRIGVGVPGQPGGQAGTQAGATFATVPSALGIVLLPQPRISAILVAAPAARMREIIGYIQMFDANPSDAANVVVIPLKHAPAQQVAPALLAFYQTRYPDTTGAINQIRISAEVRTNSILVQASPGDLAGIRSLIEHIDNPQANLARNEMRVVQLKNAVAVDMAQLLQASIANGILTTTPTAAGPGVTTPGAPAATPAAGGTQGLMTKDQRVQFFKVDRNGKPVESGILEDIRVNPDARTNALVISAPKDTMPLLLALIAELDVPPNARMEINIFTLKKSDALLMAQTLQSLFLSANGTIGGQATGGGGGAPTGGLGPASTTGGVRPLQITVQGSNPEGPPIIDLRLTIDLRTNSLIVAGSRNDLLVVGSIIARIEDANVPQRTNQVVRLRNAQAVDVVNALTTYLTNIQTINTKYYAPTGSIEPNREVVVVAEPITNSIMINATPEWFDIMLRMIAQMDTTPPQVVVSVLIAEVTLNGNEEFGCEIGLQSPVMFDRSLLPGAGTLSYITGNTGPITPVSAFVPSAITSTGTQMVAANGLNFGLIGNPTASLPYGLDRPGIVGYQALNDYGVGRISSTSGIGGFVFSAQGNVVNVLLRALKTQGRLTVLSRPNVQALDKQAAVVVVGQQIPLNNGSNATATGVVSVAILRQNVGVTLQVTPSITPDGRVIMRVIPEVTGVANVNFPLGNGTSSTSLSIQHLETTVNAEDGETVLLGGMISKQSSKNENKAPWLGDLPGIGSLFRFRTETTTQTELIIIMTPHIVRNRQEQERVLAEEAKRIDWVISDVMRVHGSENVGPFMPPPPPQPAAPLQPYRIIPRGQPNGLPQMQNCYPGAQPQEGIQLPQPRLLPPAQQSSVNAQPGPALVNALATVPAAPASRIVPAPAPGAAPLSGGQAGNAQMPPAPPTSTPIMPPQELQMQAPPMNMPWLMPSQTNYFDKK